MKRRLSVNRGVLGKGYRVTRKVSNFFPTRQDLGIDSMFSGKGFPLIHTGFVRDCFNLFVVVVEGFL